MSRVGRSPTLEYHHGVHRRCQQIERMLRLTACGGNMPWGLQQWSWAVTNVGPAARVRGRCWNQNIPGSIPGNTPNGTQTHNLLLRRDNAGCWRAIEANSSPGHILIYGWYFHMKVHALDFQFARIHTAPARTVLQERPPMQLSHPSHARARLRSASFLFMLLRLCNSGLANRGLP